MLIQMYRSDVFFSILSGNSLLVLSRRGQMKKFIIYWLVANAFYPTL